MASVPASAAYIRRPGGPHSTLQTYLTMNLCDLREPETMRQACGAWCRWECGGVYNQIRPPENPSLYGCRAPVYVLPSESLPREIPKRMYPHMPLLRRFQFAD